MLFIRFEIDHHFQALYEDQIQIDTLSKNAIYQIVTKLLTNYVNRYDHKINCDEKTCLCKHYEFNDHYVKYLKHRFDDEARIVSHNLYYKSVNSARYEEGFFIVFSIVEEGAKFYV